MSTPECDRGNEAYNRRDQGSQGHTLTRRILAIAGMQAVDAFVIGEDRHLKVRELGLRLPFIRMVHEFCKIVFELCGLCRHIGKNSVGLDRFAIEGAEMPKRRQEKPKAP